jgi:hypothetical protein
MTTKPLKLIVVLKKIDYTGGNIGNDLTFGLEVNKEFTFLEQKLAREKVRLLIEFCIGCL